MKISSDGETFREAFVIEDGDEAEENSSNKDSMYYERSSDSRGERCHDSRGVRCK